MNLVPAANSIQGQTVVLAPAEAYLPNTFARVVRSPSRHANLLCELQRLRGRVYLEDGAIDRFQLTSDGRFVQEIDQHAWHLVRLNEKGEVCGCARYMAYPWNLSFADTGIARTPLSRSREWAGCLKSAMESEIALAKRLRVDYVEVGGWALAPELRCTSEALRIALGTFSMARLLGGCIGVTTATKRHCSASILRRIGGQPLTTQGVEVPRYFDPRFDCEMEILRFDSARPNPRFERWIEELKGYLSEVPVIRGILTSESMVRDSAMTAA
ncbi:MAG TPA: hypothetical protein VK752_17140 [Bryobacteraceae bacterium]|nr:hypothetical protein [Bryobacteraceae bacterium]